MYSYTEANVMQNLTRFSTISNSHDPGCVVRRVKSLETLLALSRVLFLVDLTIPLSNLNHQPSTISYSPGASPSLTNTTTESSSPTTDVFFAIINTIVKPHYRLDEKE
ncbi:hypothetical protein L2E82_33747 [Cichorium intybus]|uniref:Uncharacterized protein n=1 Tax=Cichorium intybus TaxID=13427 RepID=A0ACB9BL08_CICIN|nr:hypothetical protein L2E82_33747 [Cichorium intybus]